jgi:hypothetical protein
MIYLFDNKFFILFIYQIMNFLPYLSSAVPYIGSYFSGAAKSNSSKIMDAINDYISPPGKFESFSRDLTYGADRIGSSPVLAAAAAGLTGLAGKFIHKKYFSDA